MRYKIYTKEQIIKAGYNIVAREGFDKFTARNDARIGNFNTTYLFAVQKYERFEDPSFRQSLA